MKGDDTMYNQKLKSDGYDGIVMMRLVDVDKSTRYVPGSNPVLWLLAALLAIFLDRILCPAIHYG